MKSTKSIFNKAALVPVVLGLLLLVDIQASSAKCPTTMFNPVTDVAWNGIFPIRVGGVAVIQNNSLPDGESLTVDPICTCTTTSETYVGTEISFWDVDYLAEIVTDAFCSPALGLSYSGLDNGFHGGTSDTTHVSPHHFLQTHWIEFPVFNLIGMLTDLTCLGSGTDMVPGDMSELDSTYNDDYLAALKDPMVFLFANPVADIACAAKNALAQVPGLYFTAAYDSLFWCSWDNIFPLSGNVLSPHKLTSTAQLVSRQLYTYIEFADIEDFTVNSCQGTVVPLMKSSQWRYQLAKPVKSATPFWAGQSELAWGINKAPSYEASDFLYVLFQKKKCCQKLKGAN